MAVSVVLALFAVLIIIAAYKFKVLPWKRYKCPPGPPGLPFIGNFFTLTLSKLTPRELFNKWSVEYGDIYLYSIFGTRFVVVSDPKLVDECFLTADINDRAAILPCNKALGRANTSFGLIGSDVDEQWKDLRSLGHNLLRGVKKHDNNFGNLVTTEASKFLAKLTKLQGAFFNPRNYLYVTVANITNSIVLGKTYDYDDEEFVSLIDNVQDVFEYLGVGTFNYHVPLLAYLPLKVNRRGDVVIKKMFGIVEGLIDQHRQNFDPEDEPSNFIDSFLKTQASMPNNGADDKTYNDKCLTQLTWDLLIAGYEGVGTSLCWYFLLMAQHPDVQKRVQDEVDREVGRERLPEFADRTRLPFTEAAIMETYRIVGIGELLLPHRSQQDCRIGGYDVPRGSFVATNMAWLGFSPKLWDNPDEFKPERFIDEQGNFDQKKEKLLGEFGVGRRSCLGEQLARTERFTIFTHVLHRFTLKLPEGTPHKLDGVCGLFYHPVPYEIQCIPR